MTTSTTYVDRLERELLAAIGRSRRKHTVVAGLAAIAIVTTALVGALLLTGSGSTPAMAIDIKAHLSEPSEVVFVVSSPTPSYWRLTAFIDFDGARWTSPAHRTDASGPRSPGFEPAVDGQTVTQTFEITGLGGSWLPAAFSPVRVDGPAGITIDTKTSSLITASTASATSAGLSYTVESVLPRYDAARLRAANRPPPSGLAERYLALPADFPDELADEARAIVAGASTRYDQAIALQNWFRGFTYDLSFPAGRGPTAMKDFLAERRGYCEQFAGTYAAFARVLGLPSRVAVGFPQANNATTAATTCRASTPTPGPRSTSTASAGCRSNPPPREAIPPKRATPASPPPRPMTARQRRHQPPRQDPGAHCPRAHRSPSSSAVSPEPHRSRRRLPTVAGARRGR